MIKLPQINKALVLRSIVLGSLGIVLMSCALVSTYVRDSGVDILKLSTRGARIVSARLWMDGDRVSLRGEVVSNPVSRSPLGGHLDIEIVDAAGTGTTCLTTKPRTGGRQIRKTYSLPLTGLPEPGSTIRVWHDPAHNHMTCAFSRPAKSTQNNGSSI